MGAAFADLTPVSLWVKMEIPGFRTRLILHSLIRAGSVQDLDQGFLACLARAFGALRAAPLLSRTLRESDKIGESAWRLWRAHRVMSSTLDGSRKWGFRQLVWIKMTPRLIIWGER